jgi:hypothetical protein
MAFMMFVTAFLKNGANVRPSEKAWLGLAAGVLVYDTFCPEGETLSEGVDRALAHPLSRAATIGAIAITGAHLLNVLPERIDPLHHMLRVLHDRI